MVVFEELDTQTRESTIMEWYKEVFPIAASHIQRKGGNLEEAKEVFQEAIVIYYEKLMSKDFRPIVSDKAYLMGIVKKRWLKQYRKIIGEESIESIEMADEKLQMPLANKLLEYLLKSGERCMDLLQSFYYERLTMKQVAGRHGFASERSATVQKYKCLEKVRNEVKRKSLSYEDFFE